MSVIPSLSVLFPIHNSFDVFDTFVAPLSSYNCKFNVFNNVYFVCDDKRRFRIDKCCIFEDYCTDDGIIESLES